MITGQEIRVLDINAGFYGTPAEKLMENAGKGVADFIMDTKKNPHVLLFCGLGNNGGDGFVAARYLAKHHPISLFLTGREEDIRTNIATMNFTKLKNLPLTIYDIRSIKDINSLLDECSVIVDAILGIGLSGELREPYKTIVNAINTTTNKTVISVDTPTGLGTTFTVNPTHTITFHDQKEGMTKENSGDIHIIDIGIPEKAQRYVGPGELSVYYPRPSKDSHKGDNGRVLIIGGGPYVGAPALSGIAALRTGADLIHIATPSYPAQIISSHSPNLIVRALSHSHHIVTQDIETIKEMLTRIDAVLIGPGLGTGTETAEAVKKIVSIVTDKKIPLVIDADALKVLRSDHHLLTDNPCIITPHAGEFAQFTGQNLPEADLEKIAMVEAWASKLGINIFLKGPTDILTNGRFTRLNNVHNEAMTVGGTGDVLAGIIVGLLAKKTDMVNTMRIAAFLNGYAGNLAFQKQSYGITATDIIDNIPSVLKTYL